MALLILQRKDTASASLCSLTSNAGQCGKPEDEEEYTVWAERLCEMKP